MISIVGVAFYTLIHGLICAWFGVMATKRTISIPNVLIFFLIIMVAGTVSFSATQFVATRILDLP